MKRLPKIGQVCFMTSNEFTGIVTVIDREVCGGLEMNRTYLFCRDNQDRVWKMTKERLELCKPE